MATTKPTSTKRSAPPVQIDCEVCRHQTGTVWFHEFSCAKAHAREKTWTLKREACADFSQMTRKEQILKRFEHNAKFHGDEQIKKDRSEVRRMATGLQKTLDVYGRFMTTEQTASLKTAAAHLVELGDDLELAGRLANQVQKDAEAERQAKEKARRAAMVEKYFSGMPDTDCLSICEDLVLFESHDTREWLCSHKRNPEARACVTGVSNLHNALVNHRKHQSPVTLAAIKENGALCIEDLREIKYIRNYATWSDFEAFRAWRQSVTEAIAKAAGKDGGAK